VISIKNFFQNNKQKLEALEKENSYYQKVAEDLNMGDRDEGMWSKAFSRSKGDHKETESIYIKLMVEKIIIEEQLKGTEEEERKKEEEKLEKEREERDRKERWEEERERRQELQEEVDRLREERKKNKQPFLREDELFAAVIISTIIFLFEVYAIVKIPTPLFYINFENIAIWDSFLFLYIFVVATISARIIRLFRSL
jgi:Fe2+ transport system protein B